MKEFNIGLSSDFEFWWRFNVYLSVVCYDENDNVLTHCNLVDKVYDIEVNSQIRLEPLDYDKNRAINITTPKSYKIKIYLYIIANTFPVSDAVSDSPCFDAVLDINTEANKSQETLKVDQLGGLTLAGKEFSV